MTTLTGRVLDLKPDGIHARCPIILGTPSDVQLVLGVYEEHTAKAAAAAEAAKEDGKELARA